MAFRTKEQQIKAKMEKNPGMTRAEAEYAIATYKGKNTFAFLDPVLDIALGMASPILLALKKGAEANLDEKHERRRAKNLERIEGDLERERQPPPELETPDTIPFPDAGPTGDAEPLSYPGYNQAQLGGIPVGMLTQLGAALMQQTPAVRQNAAKAAGRKGGKRSAARRKPKKNRAAKRARKSKRNGVIKLKKGSAAAKAWGKKMARLRKR